MHVTRKRQLRRQRDQTIAKTKPQQVQKNPIGMKRQKNDVQRIAELENRLNEAEDKIRLNVAVETKYKNILEQLKDKIECPVCMEVPRTGPVPVCPNGHFVCQKCKTDTCPTCRVEMETGKSLLAVAVIENVEHACQFSDCADVFALDTLGDHEKSCKHRTVSCPYGLCLVNISISKLVDHFRESSCAFPKEPVKIRASHGIASFRFGTVEQFETNSLNWPVYPISYEDRFFAVCVRKFENYIFFTMVMFGSVEECSEYKVDMVVHERDIQYQDSEVCFKYSGNPCSIDEEKQRVKYLGLTVNKIGMEKIVKNSDNKSFSVSFSIIRK